MFYHTLETTEDEEFLLPLKETVEQLTGMLEIISENACSQVEVNETSNRIFFYRGEIINASMNTLLSVWECCKLGFFSDAFTLLRKFRDDLLQYLFICSTIEERTIIPVCDTKDGSKISTHNKTPREKAIDTWFENTLADDDHKRVRNDFFVTSKYLAHLKKNELIFDCFAKYLEPLWERLDRDLNNYVHANGRKYIYANKPNLVSDNSFEMVERVVSTMRGIMVVFISFLMLVRGSLACSDDYVSYLDMDMTPPDGSQYRIAPGVQEFIDNDIVRVSKELKSFLNKNNKYGMQIE